MVSTEPRSLTATKSMSAPWPLGGPEEVAADAAEAVDPDADGHARAPPGRVYLMRRLTSAALPAVTRAPAARRPAAPGRGPGRAGGPRSASTTIDAELAERQRRPGWAQHDVGLDAVARAGRRRGRRRRSRRSRAARPAGCTRTRRRPRTVRERLAHVAGTTTAASTLRVERAGPEHDLVGGGDARRAPPAGAGRRPGRAPRRSMPTRRRATGHLAAAPRVPSRGLGLERRPASVGGRQRPADRVDAQQARHLGAARPRSRRSASASAGEQQVAERRGPSSVAAVEAVLERGGQRPARCRPAPPGSGAGRPAPGRSSGAAEPAARAAVVGHRHDGGECATRSGGTARERGRQAVAAADGDDPWPAGSPRSPVDVAVRSTAGA